MRPPPTKSTPGRIQRTSVACTNCRERKIKCSGEHPTCKRCVSRQLCCKYTLGKRSSKMDHHTVQSEPSYGPYPLNFHSGRQPQLRVQPQSSLSPIDRVMPGENVNFSFPSSSGPAGENICDYHPMAASFTPLYPPTFESMVPLSMPGPYESLHPSPMEYRSERSFDALIPFLATPATLPSPLYAQNAEDMAFLRGIGAHPINEPSSSSRRPSLEGSILLQPLNHLPSV